MSDKGFTLIEIILYTAIFAVVGSLTVGILLTVTQVQQRESASAEVTGQLNFVMQTIQRLVSKSSNIEIEPGVTTSSLKLRMEDPTKDPTCLSLVDGVIKLAEGSGTNPNNCTTITSELTNSRVIVNTFNFKKFVQYPGHDTVSIDLTMTYNTANPKGQVQRTLSSAIARVSAATFDSNLLPGSATFEIGQAGAPWQNLYLSGVLNLGTAASDPAGQNGSIYYNTASSTFRGYKAGAWSNLGESIWNYSGNNIYNINSGNVGIGTTTPITTQGKVLHIYNNLNDGTVNSNSALYIDSINRNANLFLGAGNTNLSQIFFVKQSGTGGGTIYYNQSNESMTFRTNNTDKMIIDTSGYVGIGTTTPAEALDVYGRFRLKNVTMDFATGTNPSCPSGTGGHLTRKWSATICSAITSCTTGSGWSPSNLDLSCSYCVAGDKGGCTAYGTCSPNSWTETVCLGR